MQIPPSALKSMKTGKEDTIGSNYTKHLKGTTAKAKANAAQGITEMIEISTSKMGEDNKKSKVSEHEGC